MCINKKQSFEMHEEKSKGKITRIRVGDFHTTDKTGR